jgi:hypothetical protein
MLEDKNDKLFDKTSPNKSGKKMKIKEEKKI